jgi:hypothetical protein
MKKIETPDVFFNIEEEILFCSYRLNLAIDLQIAKRIVEDRIKFTEGKTYPILIDFSSMKSATKEARDYMNNAEGGLKGLSGGAFLSNSIVTTMFINLYLRISKPAIPAKFFTNKREALNWLKDLKSKKNALQARPM